jgi:pimeloyl-ACP methyl ester carboxylesterase/putative sterol carrier protein
LGYAAAVIGRKVPGRRFFDRAAPPVASGQLSEAVRARLRGAPAEPLLFGRSAAVLLDSGTEATTIWVTDGRLSSSPGAVRRPNTTISGSLDLLREVVEGRASGVGAFLNGEITVRGDLSLSLALDGLFERDDQPVQWPRATLVRARGIGTAFLEAGPRDAPPVVLLHGLGGTNASMLPLMWELSTDHRVLAPDLPGFGGSAKPHARYDAPWFDSWLTAFLAEVEVDRAVLIGNSMGGRIALEVGMRSPDSVEALILLSAAAAFRRLRQWVPLVRLLRPELGYTPLRVPHSMVVETIRAMFSDPDRMPQEWLEAAADEFLRSFATREGRYAFLSCLRQIYLDEAYGERGFWDRLPTLRPPALFVWGDRDRLVPAAFARYVAQALPEAGAIVLEDCGHVPQFEHPEEVAAMVRGFLYDVEHPSLAAGGADRADVELPG